MPALIEVDKEPEPTTLPALQVPWCYMKPSCNPREEVGNPKWLSLSWTDKINVSDAEYVLEQNWEEWNYILCTPKLWPAKMYPPPIDFVGLGSWRTSRFPDLVWRKVSFVCWVGGSSPEILWVWRLGRNCWLEKWIWNLPENRLLVKPWDEIREGEENRTKTLGSPDIERGLQGEMEVERSKMNKRRASSTR